MASRSPQPAAHLQRAVGLISCRGAATVVALVLLSSFGCKPRVGSPCQPDQARCADKKTKLACHAGALIATPCSGPDGCVEEPAPEGRASPHRNGVLCDVRTNAAGSRCASADEGWARCADDTHRITCRSGAYRIEACGGGCEEPCWQDGAKGCEGSMSWTVACRAGAGGL